MIEATRVDRWILETLQAADVADMVDGRVWADQAPQGAEFPYIVFSQQATSDTKVVGSARVMVVGSWQVRVVDRSASYPEDIADAVDAALDGATGTADDVLVECSRDSTLRYPETDRGVEYRHLGGVYDVHAHPV